MTCPACASAVGVRDRSCPRCGSSLDAEAESPTRTIHVTERRTPHTPHSSRSAKEPSSGPTDHGRFLPGTLLLERYHIQGLLGRGGMGEVYRADDLKLGQQVALKFLPPELAVDPDRLARFHAEVRLARQVSHPNVCRVYDIAEVDGQTFLSMEFIDGEDLATLLRRIGRLPRDKALEMGRQLCSGLAAAHDRGILHRDLKPANVMLDGRGRARITDFGLASVAGIGEAPGSRAGTPTYMAPEQLAGEPPTERSDLYALGLVLYEIFTGKRAFRGETVDDLVRSHDESTPTPPSTLLEGLDPAVERLILRCLEKDPKRRPISALAVAAALHGGDSLAIALAAGETPSPEMVAAAGEMGGLSPGITWACLAGLVAGAAALVWLGGETSLLHRAAPPRSTDVLVDRAQDLIRRAGYTDRPAGTAYGFGYHRSYLEHIRDSDRSAARWDRLSRPQPPALFLWYRQSPRRLEPANVDGVASLDDPPPLVPGMVSVMLTANGDLWNFEAVPPQFDEGSAAAAPDWRRLFTEAGLRLEEFKPVAPRWVPSVFGESRAAWEGSHPDAPEFGVRVEAASYGGRPVSFRLYWPWNRPLRSSPFEPSASEEAAGAVVLSLVLSAFAAGVFLARRNVRMGRVDRKGAFRLAACVFAASLAASLLAATHIASAEGEWELLVRLGGQALFVALMVWLYYIALEPLVRRRWPDRIISWTRLLAGRIQDPMVGRDLLIGMTGGVGLALVQALLLKVPAWCGQPPVVPRIEELDLLRGPRLWGAGILKMLTLAVGQSLVMIFALAAMRIALRRQWAAVAGFFLLGTTITTLFLWKLAGAFALGGGVVMGALITLLVVRFGVLALVAALYSFVLLTTVPIAGDFTAWYALPGLAALLVLAALTAFAARAALAGRSLLEIRVFEE